MTTIDMVVIDSLHCCKFNVIQLQYDVSNVRTTELLHVGPAQLGCRVMLYTKSCRLHVVDTVLVLVWRRQRMLLVTSRRLVPVKSMLFCRRCTPNREDPAV